MSGVWRNEDQQYRFIVYKADSFPNSERLTRSPLLSRPKRHVAFKDVIEEDKRYDSYEQKPLWNNNNYINNNNSKNQENVDKEADEFIKHEHKKFQWTAVQSNSSSFSG